MTPSHPFRSNDCPPRPNAGPKSPVFSQDGSHDIFLCLFPGYLHKSAQMIFTLPFETSVLSHYRPHRATLTAGSSPHTSSSLDGRQAGQSPSPEPTHLVIVSRLFRFLLRRKRGLEKLRCYTSNSVLLLCLH